jgi:hypothetical protein
MNSVPAIAVGGSALERLWARLLIPVASDGDDEDTLRKKRLLLLVTLGKASVCPADRRERVASGKAAQTAFNSDTE